jgi:hypothetical protein
MGMFDSIWIDCPTCEAIGIDAIEFQSKSGECVLHDYTLEDVPAEVLLGVYHSGGCRNCKRQFELTVKERKVVTGYVAVLVPKQEIK